MKVAEVRRRRERQGHVTASRGRREDSLWKSCDWRLRCCRRGRSGPGLSMVSYVVTAVTRIYVAVVLIAAATVVRPARALRVPGSVLFHISVGFKDESRLALPHAVAGLTSLSHGRTQYAGRVDPTTVALL